MASAFRFSMKLAVIGCRFSFALGVWVWVAGAGEWAVAGCQVLGLAVGVGAGLPGSRVSGRSQCRVAAFGVCGLHELANFFITISHCAWRRVISLSKAVCVKVVVACTATQLLCVG